MISYILRHGQTSYSKRYLVNGDPAQPIQLTEEGRRSLSLARVTLPIHSVRTWLSSEFPRAQQTTSLLMGISATELVIDRRLNELDYGRFEGGPFLEYAVWLESNGADQRPPASTESQREGIHRMLTGVLAALEHRGPRVLVCHGLLVSVLLWHRDRSPGEAMPLFFSEAPYAELITLPDDELPGLIMAILADLDVGAHQDSDSRGDAAEFWFDRGSVVATVDGVSHSPEQKDLPHA